MGYKTGKGTEAKVKRFPKPWAFQFQDVWDKCSLMAIAFMFGIGLKQIQFFFKLAGYKEGGTTNYQCRKVITILANARNKTVRYTSNKYNITLKRFLESHTRGSYMLNQHGHIAACINGSIIDDWSTNGFKLMGWWRIYHNDELFCRKCKIKFERVMVTKPDYVKKVNKRKRSFKFI